MMPVNDTLFRTGESAKPQTLPVNPAEQPKALPLGANTGNIFTPDTSGNYGIRDTAPMDKAGL